MGETIRVSLTVPSLQIKAILWRWFLTVFSMGHTFGVRMWNHNLPVKINGAYPRSTAAWVKILRILRNLREHFVGSLQFFFYETRKRKRDNVNHIFYVYVLVKKTLKQQDFFFLSGYLINFKTLSTTRWWQYQLHGLQSILKWKHIILCWFQNINTIISIIANNHLFLVRNAPLLLCNKNVYSLNELRCSGI